MTKCHFFGPRFVFSDEKNYLCRELFLSHIKIMGKKLIKALALACGLCVLLVACGKEDPITPKSYYYVADGSFNVPKGDTSGFSAETLVSSYQAAINRVQGSDYDENDNAIVSACDAIYEKTKGSYPTVSGKVTIYKHTLVDFDETTSTLKTYSY